ncbi:P-loop containing nucleoside triphosphate hydrolase protein [Leucogyrophana mollusca]|uniref:P-loop containing nucleoside triphosphate hydrolase protein n=1 Tax=Leucogyrophana mollusca TaxID=85980 RepID=A0ACB8BCG0_9AGAM|nr:P-loop containing nucleoside triphosphate hydrolase protein [Leucogyrophana mollusca]
MSKVILVGVGGATCSGKTTLAKHLKRILPNSVIIHQDDFAPPQDLVPVHPVYQVQDWDAAPGAIEWPRLVKFLKDVKADGKIPPDHKSHDHLNEQKDVPISDESFARLRAEFERIAEEKKSAGEEVVWGLVDGFLLYWHQEVIDQLDVRIFLRVPHDVLKQRRHERHGYHTAEGSLWRDPPHYWEQIVYPAYVDAHQPLFEHGDVEKGRYVEEKVKGLVLLEGDDITMTEMVERSCEVLKGM